MTEEKFEVVGLEIFRKCCPVRCYYCKFVIDACGGPLTCPKCGYFGGVSGPSTKPINLFESDI